MRGRDLGTRSGEANLPAVTRVSRASRPSSGRVVTQFSARATMLSQAIVARTDAGCGDRSVMSSRLLRYA